MIHFNCPHCGRFYELPGALAGLPLVCKQCGQRVTPPRESTAAPPAPKPVAPPPPPPAKAEVPPAPKLRAPAADEDEDVLVAKPDSTPDIDFNIGGPTAQSLSDAHRARPPGLSKAEFALTPTPNAQATPPAATAAADEPGINLDLLPKPSPPPPAPWRPPAPPLDPPEPTEDPEPTLLPFVADLVAFVLLVVAGIVVGEVLVRKPTGEVLSGLASPKFPPVELLLWGGPAALLALVYLLLHSRGRTLGAWLRRRTISKAK